MTRSRPIAAVLLAVMAGAAFAGPAAAKSATQIRQEAIEKREAAQIDAIQAGRRDGGLTWWEKMRLQREQRRIAKLDARVMADGKITKSEYLDVKAAQNSAGAHIAHERHDSQVRGWWWRTFSR
jgi:ABC-type glycerol-3-phosphate transport system substrate-binding protein